MNDEQLQPWMIDMDAMRVLGEALQAINAAAALVVDACLQAWNAIQAIMVAAARDFTRIWRAWRATHCIPRQYRDTMMRRKIARMTR
jgi:hypothetical protein